MKFPKFKIKGHIAEIINYIFQAFLLSYLILLLVEQIWEGSVSAYFNLNYLLIAVIISGIFDVFSEHTEKKKEKIKLWDYIFTFALGFVGFAIIKFKTEELGWLSWLISIIAGILIILLSLLILEEEKPEAKIIPKKIFKNKKLVVFLIILLSIFVFNIISVAITLFTDISYLESIRIILGSVYVLFLPGFIISFIFFPKIKQFDGEPEKGAIDWIERIALSFALSIAIVPLAVFYLNLIGLKINLLNSFLTILGIIIISSIILYMKSKNKFPINFFKKIFLIHKRN